MHVAQDRVDPLELRHVVRHALAGHDQTFLRTAAAVTIAQQPKPSLTTSAVGARLNATSSRSM
jgi:hypothetical protein